MKTDKHGISKKYITYITLIFSALIVGSSLLFHFITDYNQKTLKKTIDHYSGEAIHNKTETTLFYLNTPEPSAYSDFRQRIADRCTLDRGFLGVIIFSRTLDENFFRTMDIINLHSHLEIPLNIRDVVKPSGRDNFLKKGLVRGLIDPEIQQNGTLFWQDAYFPQKIKNRDYVIQFMIASDSFPDAVGYYLDTIKFAKNGMIVFSIVLALTVIILSLVFIQQFRVLLEGLSLSFRKVAEGDLSVNINAPSESEFNELALSFNSLIEELREKETREKDLKEKIRITENEIQEQKNISEKIQSEVQTNDPEPQTENEGPLDDLFRAGVSFMKENRLDDAAAIFRTLTIIKPDGFASHFNLGVAYARLKLYSVSLVMLQKAAELNPSYEMTQSYIDKVTRLITKNAPN